MGTWRGISLWQTQAFVLLFAVSACNPIGTTVTNKAKAPGSLDLSKVTPSPTPPAAGSPYSIEAFSGDGQTGPMGTTLPTSLVAVVKDVFGTPVQDATVTWSIESGSGVLISCSTTSDSLGQVLCSFILPSTASSSIIFATAENVDTPAAFTATGIRTASSFLLSSVPTTANVGTPFNFTVTALDINNQIITDYTGTVHFTSSDSNAPTLPSDYTFDPSDNGNKQFSFTLKGSGNKTITVSQNPSASPSKTTSNIVVSPGSATHLVFSTGPVTTAPGDSITTMLVQALDSFENISSYTGTLTLSIGNNPSSGTLSGTHSKAAASGSASFAGMSINNAGSGYTLTVSGTGGVGSVTSSAFDITLGPVSTTASTVTLNSSSVPADGSTTATLTIVLKYANGTVVSGKTISLASSRGGSDTISPATAVTDVSGMAVFTVLSSTVGSTTLTAKNVTDGNISLSTTPTLSFTSTAPNKFSLTGSATPSAGGCTQYTVQIKDIASVVRNATSNVTVNLTGKSFGAFYSDNACSVAVSSIPIASGSDSNSFYYKNLHGETVLTLKASDASNVLKSATISVATSATMSSLATSSSSSNHMCALTNAGGLWCWGSNSSGQLGNGRLDGTYFMASLNHPFPVMGLSQAVTQAVLGTTHTCALLADQTVKCWGSNTYGQLGNGSTVDSTSPVTVTGLSNVISLSSGSHHSCVLLSDGSVKCWGRGSNGRLGNGANSNSSTAVFVKNTANSGNLSNVTALASGDAHGCALINDTSLECWGYGASGQLGNNALIDQSIPVVVQNKDNNGNLADVSSLALGGNHSCAIFTDQSAQCWGKNDHGQLGNGSLANTKLPVIVKNSSGSSALASLSKVSASTAGTCALLSSGSVKCWGDGSLGQMGNASQNDPNGYPVSSRNSADNANLSGVSALSSGQNFYCALLTASGIQCWGTNALGFGDASSNTLALLPVTVQSFATQSPSKLVLYSSVGESDVIGHCARLNVGMTSSAGTATSLLDTAITTPFYLANSQGAFYSNNTCSTLITKSKINALSTSADFYYKTGADETTDFSIQDQSGNLAQSEAVSIVFADP